LNHLGPAATVETYSARPLTNCAVTSATRRPWKRAAASAVSSGLSAPLLLVKETP
jgi:hypothetical protein